jgi:hypothetical protein
VFDPKSCLDIGGVGMKWSWRMGTRMQHWLHPINLWCRLGGRKNLLCVLRTYENTVWKYVLRPWLNGRRGR